MRQWRKRSPKHDSNSESSRSLIQMRRQQSHEIASVRRGIDVRCIAKCSEQKLRLRYGIAKRSRLVETYVRTGSTATPGRAQ